MFLPLCLLLLLCLFYLIRKMLFAFCAFSMIMSFNIFETSNVLYLLIIESKVLAILV